MTSLHSIASAPLALGGLPFLFAFFLGRCCRLGGCICLARPCITSNNTHNDQ
ncbi:hypothetical protein PF008_g17796 [Phytophthora fragariae]|uniref:Uncharacterized protein n=1 Tax=Phytophthora fragariae TaxID=53985 RepID=A0A6G0R788_9STRA|nr:hypothetical protein PF008_g17796 [Phytophthora fragariae]